MPTEHERCSCSPPPKHLNSSNPISNKVFSFALLGSYTGETLLGEILQRGKKIIIKITIP